MKDSYKMPSRVCKTWIFTFLSNLIFPWETKSWVCITCRKKCLFPDTQNMESKSDTWINFCIKVRFPGLWKMSFFGNLIKIFTICTIGKTNIFYSVENFIRLPWQKFALFWLLSSVHSLWENERSRLIYKSMIQIEFSKISFSRRYSSCWYLLYVTKKGSSAHVLGGRTVCGILQKLWISCSIWLR